MADDLLFEYLRTLLHHLPISIPLGSTYPFCNFVLDLALIEDTGSAAGALNVTLERVFGSRHPSQPPLTFRKRGPHLEGVVDALQQYISGTDGENPLLIKWVHDLVRAGRTAYEKAGEKVSPISTCHPTY